MDDYTCPSCQGKFESQEELEEHIKEAHGQDEQAHDHDHDDHHDHNHV